MNKRNLDEAELEALFAPRTRRRKSSAGRFFRFVAIFGLLYFSIFALVNFNGLKQLLSYWYKTDYKNEAITNEPIYLNGRIKINSQTKESVAENTLQIPVIGIDAPVTWRVDNNDTDVKNNLQNGLIHLNGTALPGEKGNVFITGHSSDLPWSKGKYKSVFALLGKVAVGDLVMIKYQNTLFVYRVSEIKAVQPDDLSVLKPTKDPTLTLMTCTPVGTTLRRLIVGAKQIEPTAEHNQEPHNPNQLPVRFPRTR